MQTRINGKFIQLLRTFSPEELKDFDLWLKSPWANSNKALPRLLEKLKKYAPEFDNKLLTKERLFKQVMPSKKFSNYWVNNLLSEAQKQAERFLMTRRMLADENLQTNLISQEFQNRHLETFFFKTADKEVARLEEKETKDWEDYLELLRINRRIYHHPNQNPQIQTGSPTIVKMDENLDLLYILEKAAIINEKIFRNRILKNENHDIETDLKKWRVASEGVEHLAVDLYRIRFGYTEENMREEYFKLREAFFERYKELNKTTQKLHFVSLLNDSTLLRRNGKLDISDFLVLHKFGLETKLSLNNGELTSAKFISIVNSANLTKDFEFTRKFIINYSDYLPPKIKKDASKWAYANTAFKEGNINDCLEILKTDDFQNFNFKVVSRFLRLQASFEKYLKDESYLFYLNNYFQTFEKWILREKKFSKPLKATYLNFIQRCRGLITVATKTEFSEKDILNLIQNNPSIVAGAWLKEKGNQIIKLKREKKGAVDN